MYNVQDKNQKPQKFICLV